MRFSEPASADLAQIWIYTHDEWGRAQADLYTDGLRAVAHSILSENNASRPVEFSSTVRRIKGEHHFIYFRPEGDDVVVLRILHERMDPARHLS